MSQKPHMQNALMRDRDTESLVQKRLEALGKPRSLDALKQLFWSDLEYTRAISPLPYHSWPDATRQYIDGTDKDSPVLLFATGGQGDGFHVIYIHLASPSLSLMEERAIVTRLLKDHQDALFVFSNRQQDTWHFLNVKADSKQNGRFVFRRITVGPHERLRTASERLAMLSLVGRERASSLDIRGLHEKAFDVEAVTKRFFESYRNVFQRVEQDIQGFTNTESRRLFAQRLFNRLMFIAFIQKKGWLTFDGHTDYLNALWHDYRKRAQPDSNFYLERLSLLFFTGLNTDNEVNVIDIARKGFLNSLIGNPPYLNGGLFEESEEDKTPGLFVPDSSIQTILEELFDRFNFTVTESTPLDVEVAVDPEMLGKVFEELVTGRHETGSYYTPKPVVSFMCREALKGYLHARLSQEPEQALSRFVDEHNPQELRNPEAILDVLRKVRVCDPACGSGAYLLGMLHELLDLRACLFATRKLDTISIYQRKLEIIQNNVYGVDLDPFAVNIARLRLWLSLEVDFEGDRPQPLPNLDFKIEPGDSLLAPDPQGIFNFFLHQLLVEQFRKKKAEYISAHHGEKQTMRQEILDLRAGIANWMHVDGSHETGFDWAVEFADVFMDGGFDIIVANPPYVRQELIKDLKPALKKTYPAVYSGTADLYCYFYARALQLLRDGGMLVFISSNKWFRANYGTKLKKFITEFCHILSITDFGELPVFQTAATFPMIFIAQRSEEREIDNTPIFTQVKSLEAPYPDILSLVKQQGNRLPPGAIDGTSWILADAASVAQIHKMMLAGSPLNEYVKGQIYYGIKTGFNTAFVIDGNKRNELIRLDPKSFEIIKPLVVGDDIRRFRVETTDRWLIFSKRGTNINAYPAIKRHLERWREELEPKKTGTEAKGRAPGDYLWYELQASPADTRRFEAPKILFPDIAKSPRFAFDRTGAFTNDTTFIIPLQDYFLLGVLNSTFVWSYLMKKAAVLGDAENGGRLRLKRIYVEQIPIPDASAADRTAIAALVQKCLDAQGVGCETWEREIDERVAALYGL